MLKKHECLICFLLKTISNPQFIVSQININITNMIQMTSGEKSTFRFGCNLVHIFVGNKIVFLHFFYEETINNL